MFKDVFVLRKTAWHAKLMKYIWGLSYSDFSHMCPYFWLSAFNVLAVSFVFFFRFFILGIVDIFHAVNEWLNKKYDEKVDKYVKSFLENAKNPTHYQSIIQASGSGRKGNFLYKALRKIGRIDRDLWEKIDRDRDEYWRKFYEEQEKLNDSKYIKRYNEKVANKERINRILRVVKPITKVIIYLSGAAFALFVLFVLASLVYKLTQLGATQWVSIGIVSGIIIGSIIVLILLIAGVKLAIIKWDIDFGSGAKTAANGTGNFLRKFVVMPIIWTILKVGDGVVFIIQMFKNNCPAIKWEE